MATKVIGLRVSEDEYKALEQMAERRDTTISALAYDAVLKLINGEAKPSVGSVTEEVLQEHLEQLKCVLLEELKKSDPHPTQTDPSKNAKPKYQSSRRIIR